MSEESIVPEPRSGHTSVEVGNKAYLFGGIHEVTKELNELIYFDLNSDSLKLV
jgi:hypothetical protein